MKAGMLASRPKTFFGDRNISNLRLFVPKTRPKPKILKPLPQNPKPQPQNNNPNLQRQICLGQIV